MSYLTFCKNNLRVVKKAVAKLAAIASITSKQSPIVTVISRFRPLNRSYIPATNI